MATGIYGTVKPVNTSLSDISVYYTYAPSRDVLPTLGIQTLTANQVITRFEDPISNDDGSVPLFDGLYNLQLPVAQFSNLGIYTIVIKPKETRLRLVDCGSLAAFPSIKGIVIDKGQFVLGDLVGSRVEYFDDNGQKIPGLFRIITSANLAEPVSQNLPNTTQKGIKYRYNNTSNLIFCTVTPSSAPSVLPNEFPTIGTPNQLVAITKGNFNPIMIEVEMVEHDTNTLAYGIFGNQSKGIQDGIYTIYDFDNNIYKQYNLFEVQDEFTGEPLFEVREERTNIDETKSFDNVSDFPTQ